MSGRALLIGSQTYGLTGVHHDVGLMAAALEGRGLACEVLLDETATRQGVLAAYERLADAAADVDRLVVYYSGHGGRLPSPADPGRYLQFVVPFDMADSTAQDFRGILTEELTCLHRRLTQRCRNVSVIFDCCHAGRLSRGARPDRLRARAITETFPYEAAEARRQAALSAGDVTEDGADNADLLRVVACAPSESAYERLGADGRTVGLLTEALVDALDEVGDRRVSWLTVLRRLVESVSVHAPSQRPDIEGPAGRAVLGGDEVPTGLAVPVIFAGGRAAIETPALFGLAVGDRFAVFPSEADIDRASVVPVVAAVVTIEAGSARLEPAPPGPAWWGRNGTEVVAVPERTSLGRRAVVLDGGDSGIPAGVHAALTEALAGSGSARLVERSKAPLATVQVSGDRLVVRDSQGDRLRDGSLATDARGIAAVVELVERLGRAAQLEALDAGRGRHRLPSPPVLDALVVVRGEASSIDDTGVELFAGDRVRLVLSNPAPERRWAWLFDIGVSRRVALVAHGELEAAGTPGATIDVGGADGARLEWPDDVPQDGPRREHFVAVVSDRPQELRWLVRARGGRGAAPSELEALLGDLRTGDRAGVIAGAPPASRGGTPPLRYWVGHLDWMLRPGLRPAGRGRRRPDADA